MNCPQCGKRMIGDWPDKSIWFNCSTCGDRFVIENNGELVNTIDRGRTRKGEKCENCGQSLSDGCYTAPWANGNNSDGYVKCSHCGHVKFHWDED